MHHALQRRSADIQHTVEQACRHCEASFRLRRNPRILKIAETKDQTKNNKNNALADAEAAAEPAISEFDEARPQSLSRICCLFAAGGEGPMLGDTVGPRRESSKSITTT